MIRIGIAALAMGGALWLIDMQVALYIDTTLLRILYGPALVITGVIFYVIFAVPSAPYPSRHQARDAAQLRFA